MGDDGSNLILLFGRPRSGTTWVGKIFDSHPDVAYRHEPDDVYRIDDVPLSIEQEDFSRYAPAIRKYASGLLEMADPRVAAKMPLLPKRHLGPLAARLRHASALFSSIASRLSIRIPVYDPMRWRREPEVKLVWKSVSGLGRLGAIARALPGSRAILIQRHPCGYVASQLRGLAEGRFGGARARGGKPRPLTDRLLARAERSHGLTAADFSRMTAEEQMAWRWVLAHEWTLEQIRDQPNCTTVWYDDLCAHPVPGYQRLFEFAGLEWSEEAERFLGESTGHQDDGYYSIFKDPRRASSRWRDELSPEAIDRIFEVLRCSPSAARWWAAGEAD